MADLSPIAAHILVVEDDPDIREALAGVLRGEGYAVLCATSGAEALQRLEEHARPPALILLDLLMPDMNGWEFRVRQLGDWRYNRVPVAVITAHRGGTPTLDLHGPNALIKKPFSVDDVLAVVHRLVGPPGMRPRGDVTKPKQVVRTSCPPAHHTETTLVAAAEKTKE